MALIRPCADLRNNYNEISKICHETNQPIYITKNGYNDLVILSNEAYEKFEEERVDKLISKYFDNKFSDFESFKKDFYEKVMQGLKDIEEGNYVAANQFFREMEKKYDINEWIFHTSDFAVQWRVW